MSTIARIDDALARIENAAAQPTAIESDPALGDRHRRLREATDAAIVRLDRLIGAGGIG